MTMLALWSVYDSPDDFPGKFVARKFYIEAGETYPSRELFFVSDTLEGVREQLPPGLNLLPRMPDDHPNVVEAWI